MQRYNIFNQLHKGLQALLYDTAIMIQQTAFCNPAEGTLALEKLNTLLRLFNDHARLEDTCLLPALRPFDPAAIGALETEHQAYRTAVIQLKGLMLAYEQAVAGADKLMVGNTLANEFRAFLVAGMQHMLHEEDILNRILWQRFTDREIFTIEQNIILLIPGDELAMYSQWMIRGLNNHEIIAWLKTVEKTTTRPVFEEVLSRAERELSALRWQKVQDGLIEGAMVA